MFAIFTKAAWFLAEPSSLIAAAAIYGVWLVHCGRIRGAMRWLTGAIAALLIAGFLPLSDLLIEPLENRFPRPDLTAAKIDGLITLGGAENEAVASERHVIAVNAAAGRYIETVALAIRFPTARVIFSGGAEVFANAAEPEAATAGRIFEQLGIAPERITLEDRSRTTWENATFTAKLITQKPGERWLLVTSAWQMPRAMGAFRKAGLNVEAYPVDYRSTGKLPWRLNPSLSDGLHLFDYGVREYPGLLVYWLSGRSSALFPGP